MRPDGEGTDVRAPAGARVEPSRSVERKVLMAALIFALAAVLVFAAVYLSKRAREPAPTDPTAQQAS